MRYTISVNDVMAMIKVAVLLAVTILLMVTDKANAQQMVVDDAAVTEHRSFQIESWYGTEESIFMPAVGLTEWLELVFALGFDSANNFSLENYTFESKAVNRDFEEYGSAIGLVGGAVIASGGDAEEFFIYAPYSRMIFGESSVLHINLGWAAINEGDSYEHEVIYGIRGDFGVHDRVAILAEVFTGNLETPSFHGGLRFSLIPDLLEMDITYGQGFASNMPEPGFNVGIAFTPSRIW